VGSALYRLIDNDTNVAVAARFENGSFFGCGGGAPPPDSSASTEKDGCHPDLNTTPAVDPVRNQVYIGSDDSCLYGRNLQTLGGIWSQCTDRSVEDSAPAIAPDGTVIIGSDDGFIYALDWQDGDVRWRHEPCPGIEATPRLGGPVESSAAIAGNGLMYIGSECGLHAYVVSDGTHLWHEVITDTPVVEFPPAIGPDGTVYFSSESRLQCDQCGTGGPPMGVTAITGSFDYTSADLAITKTAASTVKAGDLLDYTITVTNNGPDIRAVDPPATGVTVTDNMPSGALFVSASPGCTFDLFLVVCSIGTLDTGASATVHIVVRVGCETTEVLNNAFVKGDQSDPSINDADPDSANEAEAFTSVEGSICADLAIEKTATTGGNDTITYTITATNNGPTDASNVSLSDTLDSGSVIEGAAVSSQGSCGAPDGANTITCDLGTVTTATPATIQIVVHTTSCPTVNHAGVTTSSYDPNRDNNYVTREDSVQDCI
jgi:uncharacterized repeat protein (TIGR01451 family)